MIRRNPRIAVTLRKVEISAELLKLTHRG